MIEVTGSAEAGLYGNPDDAIRDALRSLTQVHPEYRIEIAVSRYRRGEISIARAARLAGVSAEQMKEILATRGVTPELGPADLGEAVEEVHALRECPNDTAAIHSMPRTASAKTSSAVRARPKTFRSSSRPSKA